ncbi:MAG: hypothetical protein KKG59_05055 [Nanoarchaeota archaeon]|nr:hypothetical protein [Nanoarchaeota archaeon]
MQCKICNGDFKSSPDAIVLCEHKDGAVHSGCCINNCSADKKPCEHCLGLYGKNS